MMRIIKLNIIILLMLFGGITIASEKVFDNIEIDSYKVKYTSVRFGEQSINNFFIKEIARHNLTNLDNTSFTFHYSFQNSVQQISENTYSVTTELVGDKCTGDIYYKDFDISDILTPDKADFKIIIVVDGNYKTSNEFVGISLDKNKKLTTEFLFENYDNNKEYFVRIEKVRFYSDDRDKEAFYKRINLIDEYYAASSLINNSLNEFNDIQLSKGYIVETLLKLMELERVYGNVVSSEFLKVLQLENNDNAGLIEKLNKFDNDLVRYKSYYNTLLKSVDYIKINENLTKCARNYVDEIAEYFVLSQEVTHSFSTFYYKMGLLDYNLSSVVHQQNSIDKILLNTGYCNDTNEIFRELKRKIFEAYLNKAEEFINSENYYLAKGILNNANSFYSTSVNSQIPMDFNVLVSQANYGIYHSYLKVIDRAIEVGNYELAENYIEKAGSFQKENSTSIITDKYISRISEKLAHLYVIKGDQLNEQGEHSDALYCYDQANQICKNIRRFNFDYEIEHGEMLARNGIYNKIIGIAGNNLNNGYVDEAHENMLEASMFVSEYGDQILITPEAREIEKNLKYFHYKNLISSGKTKLDSGNYNLAFDYFIQAFDLEDEYVFDYDNNLPGYFQKAAAPVLVDKCKIGEVKVIKNDLEQARSIYNDCFTLQDEYGLNFEPSVQESLALLNNNIFYKHCENSIHEFDAIIDRANNSIRSGDFITAMETYDKTEEITYKNYYCEFDKELVSQLKGKYKPAADYQQLAQLAHEALIKDDHKTFIDAYQKLEDLSNTYEVIRKNIEPMPLHYLFSVKKNLALLENSLNYYKGEEEFETAFKLLAVLEANNFSNKDTKTIQQKLATKMALADKESEHTVDPEVLVEQYTDGNTWYKHFKKAYIKNR